MFAAAVHTALVATLVMAAVAAAAGGLTGVPQANSTVDPQSTIFPLLLEVICRSSTRSVLPCIRR
jgi:hypothetical protein